MRIAIASLAVLLLLTACNGDDPAPGSEEPGTPFDGRIRVGMTEEELIAEFGEPMLRVDEYQLRTALGRDVEPGTRAYNYVLRMPDPAEGAQAHFSLSVLLRFGKVVSWQGKPSSALGL